MKRRPPISVVIPCKNEELHLRACVQSVLDWAEEVLIADSGSTDNTLRIAHELCRESPHICRLVEREFEGFGKFKAWAVSQCTHDWVFVLDADERMTESLAREIDLSLCQPNCPDAFFVGFEHRFLGYRIRHGSWSHKVVRLFRKSVANYGAQLVHEAVQISSDKIGTLSHRLEHWTCTCLEKWYSKKNRYTTLGAQEMWERGRRAHFWDLILRPAARFAKSFFLRLGFLDGIGGFLVALDDAFTAYEKYLKLWAIAREGKPADPRRMIPQPSKGPWLARREFGTPKCVETRGGEVRSPSKGHLALASL